jgi:hypothetical protein
MPVYHSLCGSLCAPISHSEPVSLFLTALVLAFKGFECSITGVATLVAGLKQLM